jgi:hypothetical protein
MQNDTDFNVVFVDYGSDEVIASEVKAVVTKFAFAKYVYSFHNLQLWNKSKAINIALDELSTSHCFVSDIDMIYHPDFVRIAKEQAEIVDVTYFQVGYLSFEEKIELSHYDMIKPYRISNESATGLTLFNTQQLLSINGFDEFFHFWSSEDTDAHIRMKNKGYKVRYYDEKLLIKHQPHPTFRSKETKQLSKDFRLTNAVRLNQRRMLVNQEQNVSYVTQLRATKLNKEDIGLLENPTVSFRIKNTQSEVTYYVMEVLSRLSGEIVLLEINESPLYKSLKYRIKEIFGKNSQPFMDMKVINDILLQQIVCNFREKNYSIVIADNLKTITTVLDLR